MRILIAEDERSLNEIIAKSSHRTGTVWTAAMKTMTAEACTRLSSMWATPSMTTRSMHTPARCGRQVRRMIEDEMIWKATREQGGLFRLIRA